MIAAADFVAALDARGYRFFTGVPCSFLGGVIAELGPRYVPAANEGAALAMAAGAALAGQPGVVLVQNSGLGNLINPLTSLAVPYRIPVLLVVSMRGWPDPAADEVQHSIMGPATPRILGACTVPYQVLSADPARLEATVAGLTQALGGRPSAILVPRGCIAQAPKAPGQGSSWTRTEAVRAVAEHLDRYIVFATTGYISRELFAARDRPGNFYMQGAMGHAMAMGTAAAIAACDRQVLVLDGDGAAIMHMGGMATIGAAGPPNLVHVIIDNNAYESTGGQPSVSGTINWRQLGIAAGYRSARCCRSAGETDRALRNAAGAPGPHLIVISTDVSADRPPPRATGTLPAPEISTRVRQAFDRDGKTGAPVDRPQRGPG